MKIVRSSYGALRSRVVAVAYWNGWSTRSRMLVQGLDFNRPNPEFGACVKADRDYLAQLAWPKQVLEGSVLCQLDHLALRAFMAKPTELQTHLVYWVHFHYLCLLLFTEPESEGGLDLYEDTLALLQAIYAAQGESKSALLDSVANELLYYDVLQTWNFPLENGPYISLGNAKHVLQHWQRLYERRWWLI